MLFLWAFWIIIVWNAGWETSSAECIRVRFFGKIQKRISDLGSMDSSVSKKRKVRKRIIFRDNAAGACAEHHG